MIEWCFQYGGTPIECWVNPHSRESMEVAGYFLNSLVYRRMFQEYIESYCWIQNTYFIPMFENIPDDHTSRESRLFARSLIQFPLFRTANWILPGWLLLWSATVNTFFQWVPFILIAEALMFSLPCILWRLLNWQTGFVFRGYLQTVCI